MPEDERVPYGYRQPISAEAGSSQPWSERTVSPRTSWIALSGLALFALVVAAVIFSMPPKITAAKDKLEIKAVSELAMAVRDIAKDDAKAPLLHSPELREVRGAAFYEAMLKRRLLESRYLSRLVSINSTCDTKSGKEWLEDADGQLPLDACSYTGPRASDLSELLNRRGEDRVVLITFDSGNWNNYRDAGIIVAWSDGDVAEYLTFDYFENTYGITAEEWADPAGKLFGKKAPFQFTYE